MHSPISTMYVHLSPSRRLLQSHVHLQISWGTKQDTTVDTDLGAVIQDSHSQVDVEMLAEAADANELYEDALQNLKHRMPVSRGNATVSIAEREQVAKDYYASVRTNVCASSSSISPVFLEYCRRICRFFWCGSCQT